MADFVLLMDHDDVVEAVQAWMDDKFPQLRVKSVAQSAQGKEDHFVVRTEEKVIK